MLPLGGLPSRPPRQLHCASSDIAWLKSALTAASDPSTATTAPMPPRAGPAAVPSAALPMACSRSPNPCSPSPNAAIIASRSLCVLFAPTLSSAAPNCTLSSAFWIWKARGSGLPASTNSSGVPGLPWNASPQVESVAPGRSCEMSPSRHAVLSQLPPVTFTPIAAAMFQITSRPQSSWMLGM
jgi:hypothetical protein